MSEHSDSLADSVAVANAAGLMVVLPAPNQAFLDIDSDAGFETFQRNAEILKQIDPFIFTAAPSKSGGQKRHITLTFERKLESPLERIAIQALLGSDLKHEALSYVAHRRGHSAPTMFFEKPARVDVKASEAKANASIGDW